MERNAIVLPNGGVVDGAVDDVVDDVVDDATDGALETVFVGGSVGGSVGGIGDGIGGGVSVTVTTGSNIVRVIPTVVVSPAQATTLLTCAFCSVGMSVFSFFSSLDVSSFSSLLFTELEGLKEEVDV